MSQESLDCYLLPSHPLDLLLPVECIADVVSAPTFESVEGASAAWMVGHANWENQRIPVLSYDSLLGQEAQQAEQAEPLLVVLNPIPNAARKAYSGLICYGEARKISINSEVETGDIPQG